MEGGREGRREERNEKEIVCSIQPAVIGQNVQDAVLGTGAQR
jgi:hypothetical protein